MNMNQSAQQTAAAAETVYSGDMPPNSGSAQLDGDGSAHTGGQEVTQSGNRSGAAGEPGESMAAAIAPPVDIIEDEHGITLIADLPGVSRERLNIKVTGDNLLIEGAAAVPNTGEMELIYGEVRTPNYRRSFMLSRELDPAKIDAKLANGVLRLSIPKAEEARPRRIQVNVS
jgi:HSP20 family protein